MRRRNAGKPSGRQRRQRQQVLSLNELLLEDFECLVWGIHILVGGGILLWVKIGILKENLPWPSWAIRSGFITTTRVLTPDVTSMS